MKKETLHIYLYYDSTKLNRLTICNLDKFETVTKVNYQVFEEDNKKAGYFFIASDKEMSPADMLNFYRHRDLVEKNFMLVRS